MKLYIAGPMTSYPLFNYPAFYDATKRLMAAGYEVTSPAVHLDTLSNPKPWDFYMRSALGLLIQTDAVALLPGWPESKGATLERHVAESLGMEIRTLEEWLS